MVSASSPADIHFAMKRADFVQQDVHYFEQLKNKLPQHQIIALKKVMLETEIRYCTSAVEEAVPSSKQSFENALAKCRSDLENLKQEQVDLVHF